MNPLERSQFPLVRSLFDAPHLGYIMDSVIAGHTAADVWADDPDTPRSAFMWDGVHGYYLAGEASGALADELAELLAREIAPEALRRDRAFFKVVCATEGWAERLAALFAPASLRSFPRTCFTLAGASRTDWCERIPEGFRARPIAADLLADPARPNVEGLTGEILQMWGTVEHFLADGFGWCALCGEAIAGWCTAEYLSPAACGLGVETVEDFQRRGLGAVLAAASLEAACARGLLPHWDAWTGNVPSIRVAEKTGLTPISHYTATVGTWEE